MCGILTYFTKGNVSANLLSDFIESLQLVSHRGPDASGLILINTKNGQYKSFFGSKIEYLNVDLTINYNMIIGHKRLKVIDISDNGAQPMNFGDYWITYNGEIYNYIEIKKELIENGYTFKSSSDTEVILKAYDLWGMKCVEKFNGMWSFVIFNCEKEEIFVSNDSFGIKPLYYYNTKNDIIFGSELKQFKSFRSVDLSINKRNIDVYLKIGVNPTDYSTYYNEVKKFPNGNNLAFDLSKAHNNFVFINYYNIHNITKKSIELSDAKVELSDLLSKSVKIRMRSDVKIGSSISGGIDSTLILQYLNFFSKEKIPTFSSISPNMPGDESNFVNIVNNYFNVIPHYSFPLEEANKSDYERFLNQLELGPKSMSFYAQWLISKLMRKNNVTINLVGQGADEIFGGYHTHFFRYFRFLILKGRIITYFKELNAYSELKGIEAKKIHKIVLGDLMILFSYKTGLKKIDSKYNFERLKIVDMIEIFKSDFTNYELPFFIHSDDRSSMGHSIETRHPFLDFNVVEFGLGLPDKFLFRKGWSKYILRSIITDDLSAIKWRRDKKGFSVPHNLLKNKIFKNDLNELQYRKKCIDIILKN